MSMKTTLLAIGLLSAAVVQLRGAEPEWGPSRAPKAMPPLAIDVRMTT
jgi:hypothetical protein